MILIYGLDWSAEVPYYAKRRAIMDRDMLPLDSPVMKESFERSLPNEKKLAAVLFCNGTQNQKGEVETRVEKLGFNPEPVHKDGLCEIYSSVRKSY